jgi:hypothetical protein
LAVGRYEIWKAQDPESVEEFFAKKPYPSNWGRDQDEERTELLSDQGQPQTENVVNGHGSLIANVD